MLFVPILVVVCLSAPVFSQLSIAKHDKLTLAKAMGRDVVEAVVNRIRRSEIFSDDFDMMWRMAAVETNLGEDDDTFEPDQFGGIWSVDRKELKNTQNARVHPNLPALHQAIHKHFNIQWMNVTWKELIKPIYSGLAARLALAKIDNGTKPIPSTIEGQAILWKNNYNHDDNKTVDDYMKASRNKAPEELCNTNNTKVDLIVNLDASGSIGSDNFNKAKTFLHSLMKDYSLDTTKSRLGLIVYDDSIHRDAGFDMGNKSLTKNEILRKIIECPYPSGGTDTNKAVQEAIDMFKRADPRPSVPKVMATFTDGQGGLQNDTMNKARQEKIKSYAVGIGSQTNPEELLMLAYGIKANVHNLTNYDSLREFFKQVNRQICQTHQEPILNRTIPDTIFRRQRRYFIFDLTSDGITIFFKLFSGYVRAYYAYTEPTPSSAVYDGEINCYEYLPPKQGVRQVYVTVEGTDQKNNYTIKALRGDIVNSFTPLDLAGCPSPRKREVE